jgi:hypothetical protein
MGSKAYKGMYIQRIYEIINERRCVRRAVIIDIISKEFNIPKEKAEDIVKKDLRRLLEIKLVERRGTGFYCIPQS